MSEEKKKHKKRKDPRIEKEYYEEIEVTDPKTGEKKLQKVKITRYKAAGMTVEPGNKGLPKELRTEEFDFSWDLEGED